MKVAAVIPARLGSRRFPRKVLARTTGKFLVQHVYERVVKCAGVDRVIVATDSTEVRSAAESFGAEVRMTSANHASGTDRVAEVAEGLDHDVIINVQGDEPLLAPDDLSTLLSLFEGDELEPRGLKDGGLKDATRPVVMTTLAVERRDLTGYRDPNIVKVVIGESRRALYFSRSSVPFGSDELADEKNSKLAWYQHVGIYAYRREFLLELATLPPSPLEGRERLEQLRVLEAGHEIRVGLSEHAHLGIDTEEEYACFVEEFARMERSL